MQLYWPNYPLWLSLTLFHNLVDFACPSTICELVYKTAFTNIIFGLKYSQKERFRLCLKSPHANIHDLLTTCFLKPHGYTLRCLRGKPQNDNFLPKKSKGTLSAVSQIFQNKFLNLVACKFLNIMCERVYKNHFETTSLLKYSQYIGIKRCPITS